MRFHWVLLLGLLACGDTEKDTEEPTPEVIDSDGDGVSASDDCDDNGGRLMKYVRNTVGHEQW